MTFYSSITQHCGLFRVEFRESQSRMDNPETQVTLGTRYRMKTNKTKNTTQKTTKDKKYRFHKKKKNEIGVTEHNFGI